MWTVEDNVMTLVNDWGSIEAEGVTYVIYEVRLTGPSEHTVTSHLPFRLNDIDSSITRLALLATDIHWSSKHSPFRLKALTSG